MTTPNIPDFEKQCCGTCVFWKPTEVKGQKHVKGTGQCRRHPPQVFVLLQQSGLQIQGKTTTQQTVSQGYPHVIGEDRGCGEYRKTVGKQLEEWGLKPEMEDK